MFCAIFKVRQLIAVTRKSVLDMPKYFIDPAKRFIVTRLTFLQRFPRIHALAVVKRKQARQTGFSEGRWSVTGTNRCGWFSPENKVCKNIHNTK
jgi:hypothetical protein